MARKNNEFYLGTSGTMVHPIHQMGLDMISHQLKGIELGLAHRALEAGI